MAALIFSSYQELEGNISSSSHSCTTQRLTVVNYIYKSVTASALDISLCQIAMGQTYINVFSLYTPFCCFRSWQKNLFLWFFPFLIDNNYPSGSVWQNVKCKSRLWDTVPKLEYGDLSKRCFVVVKWIYQCVILRGGELGVGGVWYSCFHRYLTVWDEGSREIKCYSEKQMGSPCKC